MSLKSQNKLLEVLYEYEVMTAQQLASVLSYQSSTIYKYTKNLMEEGLLGKIDVPAIGRGSKAFHLTVRGARQVAEDRNELEIFREKDWNTPPSSILNTLLGNQFVSELIRVTKDIQDSGIVDWRGTRTLFQPYLISNTKLPPKLNGYFNFYFEGRLKLVYLNVLTGNESVTVITEMLKSHLEMIQQERSERTESTLFLFLYLGKVGNTVLKLWKQLIGENKKVPFLAAANFEKLTNEGIFGSVWHTQGGNAPVSFLEMPGIESKSNIERDFIGKKQIIRLQFNPVVSTMEFNRVEDIVVTQDQLSGKPAKVTNGGENGIDWSIN